MIINSSSDLPHTVTDYDYTFLNGFTTTITIDSTAGDTIDTSPTQHHYSLSAKPSPTNPDLTMMAESGTINMQHVMAFQQRARIIQPVNAEARVQFQQTLLELTNPNHTTH